MKVRTLNDTIEIRMKGIKKSWRKRKGAFWLMSGMETMVFLEKAKCIVIMNAKTTEIAEMDNKKIIRKPISNPPTALRM